MVNLVKATAEGSVGKSLYLMAQGYIESITLVRQFPHLDCLAASLPTDGLTLPVFWAISMDIPALPFGGGKLFVVIHTICTIINTWVACTMVQARLADTSGTGVHGAWV